MPNATNTTTNVRQSIRVRELVGLLFILAGAGLAALGFAAQSSTGPRLSVTACGTLNTANATYVLQNDVNTDGTCFSIVADNITLDLNGHTVTYGQAGATGYRYGVVAVACDDPDVAGNGIPCADTSSGQSFQNLVVTNGAIVEGGDATTSACQKDGSSTPTASRKSFCHAIRIGQGTVQTATLDHLDLTVSGDSSSAIYASGIGGGLIAYNNTIRDQVTTIRDAESFDGATIKHVNDQTATVPDDIHGNTILNGPQAGIVETVPGSSIVGNYIVQGATYPHDYCVAALASNIVVNNNSCRPTSGRGVLVGNFVPNAGSVSGVKVTGNVIAVENISMLYRMSDVVNGNKVPQSYADCETDGSIGIDLTTAANNVEVGNNSVLATLNSCPGTALRITAQPSAILANSVHDNYFATLWGSSYQTIGRTLDAANVLLDGLGPNNGTTFTRNTMTGDRVGGFSVGPNGMSNVTWQQNMITQGAGVSSGTVDDASWSSYRWQNLPSVSSTGSSLVDTSFSRADYLDPVTHVLTPGRWRADMKPQPSPNGPADFTLSWTTTFAVKSTEGAIEDASIAISDAKGKKIGTFSTDSRGRYQTVLAEGRVFNGSAQTLSNGRSIRFDFTSPYQLTVSKTGFASKIVSAAIDAKKTISISLNPTIPGTPSDTTPPYIMIKPLSRYDLLGSPVTLTADATDASGIKQVSYYRDDGVLLGTATKSPYSVTWDSSAVTGDSTTIYAEATDASASENIGVSPAITVSRAPSGNTGGTTGGTTGGNTGSDTGGTAGNSVNPFTLAIIQPATGAQIPRAPATLAAITADAVGKVNVTFTVDGVAIGTNSSSPAIVGWDAASANIGYHVIGATAVDAQGQTASANSIVVYVTSGPVTPSLKLTYPANGAQLYGKMKFAVAAVGYKVTKVQFYRDNKVLIGTAKKAPFTITADVAKWKLGGHRIYAVATISGKPSIATSKLSMTVVPNRITWMAPKSGAKVKGTKVVLQAKVEGTMKNKRVRFLIDGKKVVATDGKTPWKATLNSKKFKNGLHTLTARVIDSRNRTIVQVQRTVNIKN